MRAGRSFLQGPGGAAVSRRDDAAVGAGRPAARRIVRRESDRVKMIFDRGLNPGPSHPAVCRPQHDAARTGDKRALAILNIKAVETCAHTRVLTRPLKTAIGCVKD